MNRILLTAALVLSSSLHAIEVDPKLAAGAKGAMPSCPGATMQFEALQPQLPARFSGALVRVESADGRCNDRAVAVLSPAGNVFVGMPWPIATAEGATIEEKLKNFAWRMKQNMTATVERKRTADGLFPVTLTQTTASGPMPIEGFVDPEGVMFFLGSFHPAGADIGAARMKAFTPYLADSPARGAANGKVTIVEFSDFQCPSCKHAAGFVDPIVAEHGDVVRYVRIDLPLSGHAWAFPAALAGRAIHRQNPELFWEYKKQVYENQSSMNALMFSEWARNFAADHDLDLTRYDADLASETLQSDILRGAGAAFANQIRATPSYLVNGVLVTPMPDGSGLAAYVDALLAK